MPYRNGVLLSIKKIVSHLGLTIFEKVCSYENLTKQYFSCISVIKDDLKVGIGLMSFERKEARGTQLPPVVETEASCSPKGGESVALGTQERLRLVVGQV
jgi:hypothetical protein